MTVHVLRMSEVCECFCVVCEVALSVKSIDLLITSVAQNQGDSSVGESLAEKVKQGTQRVTLVRERIAQKMKLILQ